MAGIDIHQANTQVPASPREKAFQSFDADAHDSSCLDVRKLLIILKHDRFALPFGKHRQRGLYSAGVLSIMQLPVRRRAGIGCFR